MRIAEVIGKVTLSQCLPSFDGALLPLVVPQGLAQLQQDAPNEAEPLVVYDCLGAGQKDRIALSEGGEAAQPFYPELKPVDAYNAAILDVIDIERIKDDGKCT
jgi:microcompartment protein CcmK/EutM